MISTIHQPSSDIFHQFDKVLVLNQKGHLIYNDTPGQAIEFVKETFQKLEPEIILESQDVKKEKQIVQKKSIYSMSP